MTLLLLRGERKRRRKREGKRNSRLMSSTKKMAKQGSSPNRIPRKSPEVMMILTVSFNRQKISSKLVKQDPISEVSNK